MAKVLEVIALICSLGFISGGTMLLILNRAIKTNTHVTNSDMVFIGVILVDGLVGIGMSLLGISLGWMQLLLIVMMVAAIWLKGKYSEWFRKPSGFIKWIAKK